MCRCVENTDVNIHILYGSIVDTISNVFGGLLGVQGINIQYTVDPRDHESFLLFNLKSSFNSCWMTCTLLSSCGQKYNNSA